MDPRQRQIGKLVEKSSTDIGLSVLKRIPTSTVQGCVVISPSAAASTRSPATVRTAGINASGHEKNAGGDVPFSVRDQPVPINRVAHPPVLLLRALPIYPTEARLSGIEGRVLLRAVIDRTGAIENDVSVVESVAILDAAAIEALRKWRFKPGSDRDGHPLRVLVEVPLHFSLH